ncbi:hypothetical protein [uncultured Lacinutrix sp.]|uniref:hypothetical protein n=1 Tax=uncultured Lacinutrix sp. TaxID=574032 RepID=UPI002626E4A7|nr:hypothetical protein [uncultured Lacinutrix sp.]
MISTIVGYDDNDYELGEYFEESFNNIKKSLINNNGVNLIPIQGLDCTEEKLEETIDSFNGNNFVVIGLMHGNDEQIGTENEVFVDADNIDHLDGSLFYTPACSTAIILGKSLEDVAETFVGCNEITLSTYEKYNDIYIDCENYCIKEFLNSELNIETCFNNMINYFDEQIELLSEENDEILVAMELINNRDAFRLLGNRELTKTDLVN